MGVDTFEKCIKSLPTGRKHLLVGNGFSRACREDIFSYNSLFDSAKLGSLSKEVSQVFGKLNTTDFEKVMNALEFSHQVLGVYSADSSGLIDRIIEDINGLKNVLVDTIARNHPSHPSDIADEEYRHCVNFLSNFDKVYSTNYDMLLYWATMKAIELKLGNWDDGFRDPFFGDPEDYVAEEYVEWQNSGHKQNIHYLHGALHLFYSGPSLQKYCWSRTGTRLLEQINSALESRKYPLIVAEGSSEQKLEQIQRSNYLGHNYRSLGSITGSLFIYGLSFSENDSHIVEQIRRNTSLKKVFVSLYGDPSSEANRLLIKQSLNLKSGRPKKKPLELCYYDAQTANIWG